MSQSSGSDNLEKKNQDLEINPKRSPFTMASDDMSVDIDELEKHDLDKMRKH